jgi:hypothetical protein
MTRPRPRRLGPRITPPWPQHGMGLAVDQGSMRRPAFSCNHSICGRPKRSFSAATHSHRAPCRWGAAHAFPASVLPIHNKNDRGAAAFPTAIDRRAVATGLTRPAGKRLVVFKRPSRTSCWTGGIMHPRHNICALSCPTPFSVQAHTTAIAC